MKKQSKYRYLSGLVIAVLLTVSFASSVAGDTLDELQEQKEELTADVQELNDNLQSISDSLTELQTKIDEKNNEIAATQEEIDTLTELAAEQNEAMAKRIQYNYEHGSASFIEVLFAAESFADFINRAEYVVMMHDYDRAQLEEYQTTLVSLEEEQALLETARAELEESLAAQETAREEAESMLADVRDKIAATEEEIASAEEEERQEEAGNAGNGSTGNGNSDNGTSDTPPSDNNQPDTPPVDNPPPDVSQSDLALLAAIIECEAVGEGYEGKLGVGSVVLNRVDSPYFPNTILEVLYQKNQFSPIRSGKFAKVLARGAEPSCVQAAQEVLGGHRNVDALYFRLNNGQFEGTAIGNIVFF